MVAFQVSYAPLLQCPCHSCKCQTSARDLERMYIQNFEIAFSGNPLSWISNSNFCWVLLPFILFFGVTHQNNCIFWVLFTSYGANWAYCHCKNYETIKFIQCVDPCALFGCFWYPFPVSSRFYVCVFLPNFTLVNHTVGPIKVIYLYWKNILNYVSISAIPYCLIMSSNAVVLLLFVLSFFFQFK